MLSKQSLLLWNYDTFKPVILKMMVIFTFRWLTSLFIWSVNVTQLSKQVWQRFLILRFYTLGKFNIKDAFLLVSLPQTYNKQVFL